MGATRGPYIGDVFLAGRGLCRVFTDLDNTSMVILMTSDGTQLLKRRDVIPRSAWRRRTQAAGRS